MKHLIPFIPKPAYVPVIRLSGAIGGGTRGLSDAGLAPLIERAFARGKPAAGVRIMLYRVSGNSHKKIAETVTNADGRTGVFLSRLLAVRADRRLVFDQYFGTWKKFEGTAGSMLTTQIMGDHFTARSRHFDSALRLY